MPGAEVVPCTSVSTADHLPDGGQPNVHDGPGATVTPLARSPVPPGGGDRCFEWPGPIAEAAHLERRGVAVELGPRRRPGECGFGRSVHVRDPNGPSLGFISDVAP